MAKKEDHKPRLSEVKVGQFWYLNCPRRFVKVVDETVVSKPKRDGSVDVRPAMRVMSTIPTVPIKGCIGIKAAAMNREIVDALQVLDHPGLPWEEIWCERSVLGLKKMEGVLVEDEREPRRIQLVCWEERGRGSMQAGTSPCRGGEIIGRLVGLKQIPQEVHDALKFDVKDEPEEDDEEDV